MQNFKNSFIPRCIILRIQRLEGKHCRSTDEAAHNDRLQCLDSCSLQIQSFPFFAQFICKLKISKHILVMIFEYGTLTDRDIQKTYFFFFKLVRQSILKITHR